MKLLVHGARRQNLHRQRLHGGLKYRAVRRIEEVVRLGVDGDALNPRDETEAQWLRR